MLLLTVASSSVAVLLLYWMHAFYYLPSLDSLSNIVDEFSQSPDERDFADWAQQEAIPTVVDLPATYVSNVLYLPAHERGPSRTPAGQEPANTTGRAAFANTAALLVDDAGAPLAHARADAESIATRDGDGGQRHALHGLICRGPWESARRPSTTGRPRRRATSPLLASLVGVR